MGQGEQVKVIWREEKAEARGMGMVRRCAAVGKRQDTGWVGTNHQVL